MGYSRKKNRGVEGGFELSNTPTLPGMFFSLLETPQGFVITPLGDLRSKTKSPGNSTFFITFGNSTLFLINLFVFLWNIPMKECLNFPLSI